MSKLDLINIRVIPKKDHPIVIDCEMINYDYNTSIDLEIWLSTPLIAEQLSKTEQYSKDIDIDIHLVDTILRYYFKTYIVDKNRDLSKEVKYRIIYFDNLNEFITFISEPLYPEYYLSDLFE